MENRNMIVLGLQSWDEPIATTVKYTALEFAKKNKVIFVNPPIKRSWFFTHRNNPMVIKTKQIIKGQLPDLVQVNNNLWVLYPKTIHESINWIKIPQIFDLLNKINDKRLAKQIKIAVERLNFKNFIFFNDNSMITGYYLKELLKPSVYVYLLRDAVTMVSYHQKHGTRLHPDFIKNADIAVCNSYFFENYMKPFNPNTHFIGQGVDIDLYCDPEDKLVIPDDLNVISKPIVGYTGFLSSIRLDIELILFIAKKRPDWSIVLIGPEDVPFRQSELHELNNVYFLGRKAPNLLPAYVKGFDVGINPQYINEITNTNYPLKIDEYLALGKAVVASATDFMRYFKDYVYLAVNGKEYVTLVEKALLEDSEKLKKSRIEYAKSHSWSHFVQKIYDQIITFEKKEL